MRDEDVYRISKQFLGVEQFHGHSEHLVEQELFAHFNLLAMARLLTRREAPLCAATAEEQGQPLPQANFKHSLAALAPNLEGLLLHDEADVRETLDRVCKWIGTGDRRRRPNRSYPRRSLRPSSKWDRRRDKQSQPA